MPKHSINIQPGDIITPANFVSLVGLSMVLYGAVKLNTSYGVILMVIGRSLDLLDGPLARRTHTSRFGAVLDALSDKLAIASLVVACWHYEIAPIWAIIYIAVQNIANLLLSVVAELRGGKPETNREGKYAVFLQSAALGMYSIANVSSLEVITLSALIITLASMYWAVFATRGYAEQLLATK